MVKKNGSEGEVFNLQIWIQKGQDFCFTDIFCSGEKDSLFTTKLDNFSPSKNDFIYNARVSYYCGPGRAFLDEDSGEIIGIQNFTCGWDQSWQPSDKLMNCVCKMSCIFTMYFYCGEKLKAILS